MKKFLCIILVLMLSFLCACGQNSFYNDGYDNGYEAGYKHGFDEGYSEARWKYDDYSRGYDDGVVDGREKEREQFINVVEDAEHYAVITGGWHPEEAWEVVEDYRNNDPIDKPTYDEYIAAVDSLISFYEYFYNGNYE